MSAGSSTSTAAAIGLQLAGDLGHPFRRQVVRRAVRQVAAEGHPLTDRQALVQRVLVGAEELDFVDRSAHRIGIAHATVDGGRPVGAGHRARRGRAPLLAALAVTEPQPEGPRIATVQPTRRDGRQPACPPRAPAPRSGIEEEQAPGGERARIDEGRGMLDGVELAPVDRRADRAAGCPVEIAEVAVEVALVAVDRDREDVDVGRGWGRGNGAHTHAQRAPSAGRQTGGEYTGHWQSANRAEYRLNVLPGATCVPAGGSWSMMPLAAPGPRCSRASSRGPTHGPSPARRVVDWPTSSGTRTVFEPGSALGDAVGEVPGSRRLRRPRSKRGRTPSTTTSAAAPSTMSVPISPHAVPGPRRAATAGDRRGAPRAGGAGGATGGT